MDIFRGTTVLPTTPTKRQMQLGELRNTVMIRHNPCPPRTQSAKEAENMLDRPRGATSGKEWPNQF